MKLQKSPRWELLWLALAFVLPMGAMLFVMAISHYEPFGDYSMLYSDMYHQYYPFFTEFRRTLRSGGSLLYNWSVGMGMDYLGLISYYLASPLNLLSVLVPDSLVLEYFSLLMPMKLGFAGLFFAFFLHKILGKSDLSVSLFGGFYGLCAWALGFQWNVMWLDTFALTPLVALGTVCLLRDKKPVLYTLTLFLAIFANYYIGFFVCIFVALLFFCWQICRWRGWKWFVLDLGRIALFSVIAIGMTAILELPALAALQTTQSSVNKFPTGFRLNIASSHDLKGLLDAMRQVAGNMGGTTKPNFKEGLPNLYCGVFAVYFGVLYLMAGDVKLRDKFCCVFLLLFFNVSFIIRQLDYIWHGFHFTNMIPYRFSYLYSFVLLYMAYRAWTLRRKYKPLAIILGALITAGLLACSNELMETKPLTLWGVNYRVYVYILYNGGFLLLYFLGLLYGAVRRRVPEDAGIEQQLEARLIRIGRLRASWVWVAAAMGLELIGAIVSFGLYFPGTNVENYPKGTEYAASMIRYMHQREEDTLFFRAETNHSQTLNDGALNNYSGVSAFTSSANVRVTEFMKALGYGAKNTYNRYCYEESSPVADLFLGIKYVIERDGKDKQSEFWTDIHHYGNVHLLENEACLPLGFLAEEPLAQLEFGNWDNPFEFQNELFSNATGLDRRIWRKIPGNSFTVTGNGVTVANTASNGRCSYMDATSGSDITYTFSIQRDGFMCIHLDLPKRNTFYVSVNGVEKYSETISLPQMLAVGDVEAGDLVDVRIRCSAGEKSTVTVIGAVMDSELFWDGYEVLSASTWDLTYFDDTLVEGSIHCDRDGLLYTSIPQNGNWRVMVDGGEVQPVLIGDCMLGVFLTEGEHLVTFVYHNDAFALGWKITAAFALIFCGLVFVYEPGLREKFRKH